MPIQKFLELDSNYRNRNTYPNPAHFGVELSSSGTRGNERALDPVTYAYPQNIFCPNDITCTGPTGTNFIFTLPTGSTGSGSGDSPLIAASSNTILVLTYLYPANTPLSTSSGYLTGAVLQITSGTPPTPSNQLRRITDWSFLKDDGTYQYFLVTLESAITDFVNAGSITFTVFNPTDITTPTYPYIYVPKTLSISDYYDKYIMYNQTKSISTSMSYAQILGFNRDTHLAKLSDITGLNWALTDVLIVRQQLPRCLGTVGTATSNTIELSGITILDHSYINNFIRVYATTTSQTYQLVKITGIVTTTIAGTVTNTNTAIVSPSFTTIPTSSYLYEVLNFNIDNVSPFVFTGTMSSQSQPVSQEITLNSLILPNVTLKNGGRIAYYPYVYVELDNTSSTSSGNKNIIYSNNPHTYKAIFKVPITDLNHPAQSPFVKLTGNGVKQTIVFKQNDDMIVSVKLPNGELFETSSADNSNGQLPNPMLQVSMLFGIEKIT